MPQDARMAFPFESQQAQYLWVAEVVPSMPAWSYDPPPLQGQLRSAYDAVIAKWTTACQGLDTTAQDAAIAKAQQQLTAWDAARPINDTAAQSAIEAMLAVSAEATKLVPNPSGPLQTQASRQMLEVVARLGESVVTTLEVESSRRPNVVRAMWRAASAIPYDPKAAGVPGDMKAWWDQQVTDLKSDLAADPTGRRALGNPAVTGVLNSASALSDGLSDVQIAVTGKDPDAFARACVSLANTASPLSEGLRGPVPSSVKALAASLSQVLNEAWSRAVTFDERSTGKAPVFRTTSGMGTHRSGAHGHGGRGAPKDPHEGDTGSTHEPEKTGSGEHH